MFKLNNHNQYSNAYNYDDISENVNEDFDESVTHVKKIVDRDIGKFSSSKALKANQSKETSSRVEDPKLKNEIKKLKMEYDFVLNQLKEIKVEYALAVENKNENERILLNEIKTLNSKLATDYKAYEVMYSDVKSNSDTATVNINYKRRNSRSKPLSEFNECLSTSYIPKDKKFSK